MGRCYEFGVVLDEQCDHTMSVSFDQASCACAECGAVCPGQFRACGAVWAIGAGAFQAAAPEGARVVALEPPVPPPPTPPRIRRPTGDHVVARAQRAPASRPGAGLSARVTAGPVAERPEVVVPPEPPLVHEQRSSADQPLAPVVRKAAENLGRSVVARVRRGLAPPGPAKDDAAWENPRPPREV